jgi:U3 small nucleolar ribonucleoprotein protein IMP4
MLRRLQRQRKDYLYRKHAEGAERVLLEKKRRVREALEEGKPIPTELRNEEHELRRLVDLDDQDRAGTSHSSSPLPFFSSVVRLLGLCG